MPNCKQHEDCDLVCPWDGYYYHNEAHKWRWRHVHIDGFEATRRMVEHDMPDDRDEFFNERAERMP